MQPDDLPRLADAEAVLLRALARVCDVPPPRSVAEWADAERIIAAETGSPWPGRWSTDRVPYLREIMEVMTLSHPCRRVTLLKSAQIGGSEAGLNLIGQVMAETPAPVLVMLPSIDMMLGYNRLKLDPMIQGTPALSRRVQDVVSRDEANSTVTFKRFPGGYLQLLTANSGANLQMRSGRVLLLEEISSYPTDTDGRGSPIAQLEARAIAYSGREKILEISTPGEELAGSDVGCRVTRSYERSSQGRLLVPCPHCDHRQTLDWENIRWTKGQPETAQYHCQGCGTGIGHKHKAAMIAAGEWHHEFPDRVNRHAGYAINSLYSPMLSWAAVVEKFEAAQGDQQELKSFTQQYLGRAWREVGDAPDWQRIYDRREHWPAGTVPAGAVLLTAGVDVQRNRLEAHVWGWGRNRESWHIDAITIAGDPFQWRTWEQLAAALDATYAHQLGGALPISLTAVDSGDGVTTAEVYAFVRKMGRRVIAIKGRDELPQAIAQGGKVDVKRSGKKVGSLKPWNVGSSYLKGEFYGQLRLDKPTAESGAAFPRGYVHLSDTVAGEEICKQLTAEALRQVRRRNGQVGREWVRTRANEALDCRNYARAAATLLGIDRMPESRWAEYEAAAATPAVAHRPPAQLGLMVPEPDADDDLSPEAQALGAVIGAHLTKPNAEDADDAAAETPAPPPPRAAAPQPPKPPNLKTGRWWKPAAPAGRFARPF
jgi:phage terminase large subunit GpA-like protein